MGGEIPKDDWENIIWIDENIENRENQGYSELLEKSQLLKNKCTKIEEAIEILKKISFEEVKIIIAGRLYQNFVESFKQNIKDMKVAPKIIVFTMDKKSFLDYNPTYNNDDNKFYTFGGIATTFEEVKSFLQNKTEPEKNNEFEEDRLSFDYIDSKEKLTLPLSFKALIEQTKKENINNYNLNLYKEYYNKINKEKAKKLLEMISSKSNIPTEILSKAYVRLYTAETKFYYDLNENLTKNKKEKYLTYIKTIYEGIKLKSLEPYKENCCLYRGSKISNKELKIMDDYLQKAKQPGLPGAIVFSKSFLSFAMEKDVADSFFERGKDEEIRKKNLSRVMYIIKEKNNEYNLSTNCDIEKISMIPKEKEILFLPFSCFEIKEKKPITNGYEITLSYLGKYLKEIKDDPNLYLDSKLLPDSEFKKQLSEFGLIKDIEKVTNTEIKDKTEAYENTTNDNNYIIGEINITQNNINKEIQIINSFENAKKSNKNEKYNDEQNYSNESDIRDNIEIRINDELIEFAYLHKFEKKGTYKIKYKLKNNLTKINHMFYGCAEITKLDFSNCFITDLSNTSKLFYDCGLLKEIKISKLKTQNVTDMSFMFYNCHSLSKIDLTTNFNTKNVTNMNRMFYGCYNIEELNLSNFDTLKVTDMGYMFNNCEKLEKLNLSSFNTRNVTDMGSMFNCCSALKNLDLSKFDTQKVTNMNHMFYKCSNLIKLNLENFKTYNVTGMNSMFYYCTNLTSLNLNNFNTSKVTDMKDMFSGCDKLTNDKIKTNDKKISEQCI